MPANRRAPFFSVVIPTKNRSFLVGGAVESVLAQSFADLELIVADNDDTPATTEVVKSFNDSRLRHLRTGGLSMPDNWEAACAEARGEYICVLEDKQMLKRRALTRVKTELERQPALTVKWNSDAFSDAVYPPRVHRDRSDGVTRVVSCESLLDAFINSSQLNYKGALPLVQKGCIHHSLVAKIKAGPMQRLCHAVTPDVILSFLQLAYGDRVLEINEPLAVYVTDRHSNGRSFTLKTALSRQFTREIGGQEQIYYDHTPIKATTIPGIVYNDYVKTRDRVGERLTAFPVNWQKYFMECYYAIVSSWDHGVDMTGEADAWAAAIALQPEDLQRVVRNALAADGVPSYPGRPPLLKRLPKQLGITRLERLTKSFVRGTIKGDASWRFRRVRDYVAWEAEQPAKR